MARRSRSKATPSARLGALALGCLSAAIGCKAGTTANTGGAGSTTGSTTATLQTSSNTGNSTSGGFGGAGGGSGACAKYKHTEVHRPVNLYVMFDKSSSMAGSKWDASKQGLKAYVENPGVDAVRAGLRFFPRPADSTPACDQMAYMMPTVPFGDLPMNATAIEAAMDAEAPNGFNTPMYPALGGAILEGIQMAQNDPNTASAVLLVTDGEPMGPATMCSGVNPEDPAVIANLAKTGKDKGVFTYVVGLPGVNQAVANQIAAAGGTDKAILVSVTNIAVEFQEALKNISSSAIPCDYAIPAEVISGEIALNKVNVDETPPGGMATTLPYDQTCASDGWQYDDPTTPTKIVLCPQTCAAVKATDGAQISVVLGCGTILH